MLFSIFSLVSLALSAQALSSPPTGAITVGSKGKYSTIGAAINDTSSSVYFIYAGTYTEQVYITRSGLTFYGETNTANNYTGNTVTIQYGLSAAQAGSNDKSGTVRTKADDISFYNINIANTYGAGAQAIALSIQGNRTAAYGVKLTGYQDTLLPNKGLNFFSHSYISGATDFIFGGSAQVWVENSQIVTVGNGYITASGRDTNDNTWYVINKSIVSGTGTSSLGRPWRTYARVVFQNTYLGSNIPAAGWSAWGSNPTDNVTYAEYGNTGPGAKGPRVSWAKTLSAPIAKSTLFGSNTPSWINSAFLS